MNENEKEKLLDLFLKENKKECLMCGTQRCDGTIDWVEGCRLWQEFLKKHDI